VLAHTRALCFALALCASQSAGAGGIGGAGAAGVRQRDESRHACGRHQLTRAARACVHSPREGAAGMAAREKCTDRRHAAPGLSSPDVGTTRTAARCIRTRRPSGRCATRHHTAIMQRFGVYRCARPMAHHQAPVWPITEPLCVLVTRTGRGRRMGWSCCGLYAPATWRRGLWGLCTDSLVLLPAACRVHREQGAPVHHRSIDPTSTRLHGEVWMAPRRNGRLLLRAALVRSWAIAVYVCVSCMIYLYITACSVGGSIPDAVLDCRRKGAWSTDRPG